ncbi:MAG: thiamine pyrophosphate-requiring protein [Proteobacteria bacterium]|nr:thiamine pyrophosphate-requiring protein [Pseudomonadota bacterium]
MTLPDHPVQTSVASRYLAQLAEHGIEHLYVNAGTDFAPLAEAYANNARASNAAFPEPVLCAHEGVAVGMAHGAYLVSEKPQAVMFHVGVGTANAICAITNAARDNVPLLVSAGRSPILEEGMVGARDTMIHWAQEMFDQAGMLREIVKWDYELKLPLQVDQVVDRALGIAQTRPKGPVYLTLPREVLAQEMPCDLPSFKRSAIPDIGAPDPVAIEHLARRIAHAEFPLIVTSASGADRQSVSLLGTLAGRFGIGVADTSPRYLNLPFDHPMHLGLASQKLYDDADVVLYLECDVPWIPTRMKPRDDAFIAHAGVDPMFARYPMRSHRSDLTLAGKPSSILSALTDALAGRLEAIPPDRADKVRRLAARAQQTGGSTREQDGLPVTKEFMSRMIGETLPADAVVFNEYWGSPQHLKRTEPGSYFFLPPSGGLGWALPAALGARHAALQTTVALVGDGAYMFANPAACHHASAKHKLPVLTIIANNATWGAVDHATRGVYPEGEAVTHGERRLSDLHPVPFFEAYCQASGGYGERVETRAELAPALNRALHAVQVQGQQALLNVVCID